MQSLEQVSREKGLPLKVIVDAMVSAIELAARKRDKARFDVEYDAATGTIRLYAVKTVVETVTDSKTELSVAQAHKIRPGATPGDDVYIERDIADLGRIAAQKAMAQDCSKKDTNFYKGKFFAMNYFFRYELPKTLGLAARLMDDDNLTVDMKTEYFKD